MNIIKSRMLPFAAILSASLLAVPLTASAQNGQDQKDDQHHQEQTHGGQPQKAGQPSQGHPQQGHSQQGQPQQGHPQQGHNQQGQPQQSHPQQGHSQPKSQPQQSHPQQGHSQPKSQPQPQPQHHAEPSHGNPGYSFGPNDRKALQSHYQRVLGHVDRGHRPTFYAGHPVPQGYRHYITPAPIVVREHLPPPPPGYTIGYYQGYTVVYDPTTFMILTVIDLLN